MCDVIITIKRYVINQIIFFTNEWFGLGFQNSNMIKQFMPLADMQLYAINWSCLYCNTVNTFLVGQVRKHLLVT